MVKSEVRWTESFPSQKETTDTGTAQRTIHLGCKSGWMPAWNRLFLPQSGTPKTLPRWIRTKRSGKFLIHISLRNLNQKSCFRPSLSRFPRQDSLPLQSALKEALAETVQSCYKDFHVAFTARQTPSLSGWLQNTDSLRNLAFLPGRARGLFCEKKHMYNC